MSSVPSAPPALAVEGAAPAALAPPPAAGTAPAFSLDAKSRQQDADALAAEFPGGVWIRYHLNPPVLLLVRLRRLRGMVLDPFGYAEVRRIEPALVGEYRGLIEKALADLRPEGYERAVKLANLPDFIRGYEEIKLRNVERFRAEVRALGF